MPRRKKKIQKPRIKPFYLGLDGRRVMNDLFDRESESLSREFDRLKRNEQKALRLILLTLKI